jgi:alginate export protein
MMRTKAVCALTATLLIGASAAASAEVALTGVSPKLAASASLRTRGEAHDFFEPPDGTNNDYVFGATLLRFGLGWKDELFDVFVEGQNSALFGLPDDAVGPAPTGPLGLGAIYFAHNRAENDASVFLKQGWAKLKTLGVEGLSVKGGRFEFNDGGEVMTGDATLDWLKNLRLSQRLIGPFGFSHVGRSFDGLTAQLTRGAYNLTALAVHPTQGGFDLAGNKEIGDIDLAYASLNVTRPEFAKSSDARFFYIYYKDSRGLLKVDNRALDARQADRDDIEIHSEGAHYIQAIPTAAGPFDVLLWGVVQQGDWGQLDHQGWAYAVEGGWQPAAAPWKAWLRIGLDRSSGDDDPNDGDHGTFFQIIPTGRIYSYSTFYNLLNDEDAFAQIVLRPMPGLVSRTDFHNVRATEGNDLWYQGSGATLAGRDVGFGYSGRPAKGHRDLFQVIETSLGYDWSAHFTTSVYYAHLFGGAIVRGLFAGDDANFGYLEATIKL